MPSLSSNLLGQPSPAERRAKRERVEKELAARRLQVDKDTGMARFLSVWNAHIGKQRDWAKDTGKFKSARGEGWKSVAKANGFALKFEFKGETATITFEGEWNRKTAQAKFNQWINP